MNARINPASLADPELRFASTLSGGRIPFVAKGEGEPLLFIHGSLCDYRYWSGQMAVLSRSFHCISLSLSHYWPLADSATLGTFSWRAHVDEVAEFIAALGIGPVHLVGHSRGGCIAFHLAHEHPHLVKSLTLADPGGPLHAGDDALPAATVALRAEVAELIGAGAIDAGVEMFVDSVSMPGVWSKSPAGFRTMATDNAATLPKQFVDALPVYARAQAAKLPCKVLLVQGEKSPRMYRDNVAALAGWIAHAQVREVAGASHGMNVTHPAVFNRALQAFLAEA